MSGFHSTIASSPLPFRVTPLGRRTSRWPRPIGNYRHAGDAGARLARDPEREMAGGPASGLQRDDRDGETVAIPCRDGYRLVGRLWRPAHGCGSGTVIVNPATGVLARYYHHFARFLTEQGFTVLTYDYRGIGESRPRRLRRSGIRWR